jgi:3-dehydroquinate synthase
LLHGEAISIGMIGSAMIAVKQGQSTEILRETKRIFEKFELPTQIPAQMDTDAIIEAMLHDKKFVGGSLNFVLPTAIGEVEYNQAVDLATIREVISQLKGE